MQWQSWQRMSSRQGTKRETQRGTSWGSHNTSLLSGEALPTSLLSGEALPTSLLSGEALPTSLLSGEALPTSPFVFLHPPTRMIFRTL